ncbi:MAG: sulfatase [Planctomycetaceae bacterium]
MSRLLLLVLFCLSSPFLQAADRPNVLLILSDDQAWTDYGFMGHDTIKTPHLDKLASQSAVFTRAYVPTSLCRPSLATLITGLYPHQHRISGNDPVFSGKTGQAKYKSAEYRKLNQRLIGHIEEHPTIPRVLGQAGYRSLQTGKWWEGHNSRGGFDVGMTHGDPDKGGRHGDKGLEIGRQGLQPIYDFWKETGDQPWFVWYAPMLPHLPHNPPERLLKKYTAEGKSIHVARYQAMCEWWDETCGELLDHLDQIGEADNTLVVYTCDNGWIQDPDSPQYAPGSKRSPNEGGLRSPTMYRWPGHIEPARYDTLISTIDFAPTVYAVAGAVAPTGLPGINLLPVCQAHGKSDRHQLFGEILDHDIVDVDVPAKSLQYRWTIDRDWKLIVPVDGPAELYNVVADPYEKHNLADKQPAEVERLTKSLNDWWSGQP